MHRDYHPTWQQNRINFILSEFSQDFFRGKRILELGPFNGYIGNAFHGMGASVHLVEGRDSNIRYIESTYPHLTVEQGNLDTPDWLYGKWDIIINFGLFYHLEHHHEAHLTNCLQNCDLMFFETVVYDSFEPDLYARRESGEDQSLTPIGKTPSTSFVEHIFSKNGVQYTKYSSSSLNGNGHHYDWVDRDSKQFDLCARRFWIVDTNK
jgi:hypothetical protein